MVKRKGVGKRHKKEEGVEEERKNEGGEQSSVPPMSFFITPHTHPTHTPLNTMTSTNVYHVVYIYHTHTHKI